MTRIFYAFITLSFLCSFRLSPTEQIVEVRAPKKYFYNLLEWEIVTTGERYVKITITHQSGKQIYFVERFLYGESYNELDASDLPVGKYTIEVECEQIKSRCYAEKVI